MATGDPAEIDYSHLFTSVHGNCLCASVSAAGYDPDRLPDSDPSAMNFGSGCTTAWRDISGRGQGIAPIDAIVPAGQVLERLRHEYQAALRQIAGHAGD